MKLEIYCVMCGKEKTVDVKPTPTGRIDADKAVRQSGWITQTNGPDFDTYCSKKCAA